MEPLRTLALKRPLRVPTASPATLSLGALVRIDALSTRVLLEPLQTLALVPGFRVEASAVRTKVWSQ